MKYKTTFKAVKRNYHTIIKVGYCDLQSLLRYKDPESYTIRAEGWASDVYDIGGGYAVSTGYQPFGNAKIDYKLLQSLEMKARNANNEKEVNLLIEDLKALV